MLPGFQSVPDSLPTPQRPALPSQNTIISPLLTQTLCPLYFVSVCLWFKFLPGNQLALHPVLFLLENNLKCIFFPGRTGKGSGFLTPFPSSECSITPPHPPIPKTQCQTKLAARRMRGRLLCSACSVSPDFPPQ